MSCQICGNEKYKIVGAPLIEPKVERFIRHEYKVVRCISCGFYYVNPEIDLSPYEWGKIYEDNYFAPVNDWHNKKRREDIKNRFDKLVGYTGVKEIDFLDVGCGEGLAIEEALSRGWNVTAVDIVDHRTNGAKAEGVLFYEGSLNNVNFKNKKFDIIYLDSVLEHTTQPMEYLRKLNELLKDNGFAYIGVPNEDSLFDNLRELIFKTSGKEKISARTKPFVSPYHVVGFNKNSLNLALKKAGLSSVEFRIFASLKEYKKYKFLSRGYLISLLSLPIYLLARMMNNEVYMEVIITKFNNKMG